jgi:hypothetical protein
MISLAAAQRRHLATEFPYTAEDKALVLPSLALQRGMVYLLHFDRPISERHTAQHYIGWSIHLPSRAIAHLRGRGARLTQVARERGIGFVIAAAWPGDRHLERRMKNRKNAPRYCPLCLGQHAVEHLDDLI